MSEATEGAGTRLTLDLWHPNCWAIEATERTSGGVLAHAIYHEPKAVPGAEPERPTGPESPSRAESSPESVNGLFTAFADTDEEIEALLEAVRASPRCGEVLELTERFGANRRAAAPGRVVREFFLEYDPGEMICPVLLRHGFVHSAPVRIEGGRERWQVYFAGERNEIQSGLEGVREHGGAEVSVSRIGPPNRSGPERERRLRTLTPTQREVFDLARERGYYEWPRHVSTRDLAGEMNVSKTTLLEHLRKAESKLLDPDRVAAE